MTAGECRACCGSGSSRCWIARTTPAAPVHSVEVEISQQQIGEQRILGRRLVARCTSRSWSIFLFVMSEHLTALDATFLELEEVDESAHMHTGVIMICLLYTSDAADE